MGGERIKSFQEFWPFFLSQHQNPKTRSFHAFGTAAGFLIAIFAFVSGIYVALFLAPVVGYGCAWYSHFFIEKNRPATLQYPVWSFLSDVKMTYLYFVKKTYNSARVENPPANHSLGEESTGG